MKKKNTIIHCTLWANRLVALLMAVLICTLPWILDWYSTVRLLTLSEKYAIMVAFYLCALLIAVALWTMETLLRDILAGSVFTRRNVQRIRRICMVCGGVGLVCFPAAFFYMPLIFVVVIMGFLCLVVGAVASVMNAAVTIREENDLTV